MPHWAWTRCRNSRASSGAKLPIEEQAAPVAHELGQAPGAGGKVHADRAHLDLREALAQACHRVLQEVGRDVDRDVLRRLQQREQAGRLGAVAGAQVDQGAAGAGGGGDLGAVLGEDGGFGAGRVVLGQFADRLEQFGAERVVQEFGRYAGVAGAQACFEFGVVVRAGPFQVRIR